MRKKLICCLCMLTIIVAGCFSYAMRFQANTTMALDANVIQEVLGSYMDSRFSVLNSGETEGLREVAVSGIINDELLHSKILAEAGIMMLASEFEINKMEECELEISAMITERIKFLQDGKELEEEVEHHIVLMKTSEGVLVGADLYIENATGFMSASYIPPSTQSATGNRSASNDDLRPTIVKKALAEVGYMEKASNANLNDFTANAGTENYTKYGQWYGNNPAKWCAQFVSWCAYQTDNYERMFDRYQDCDEGKAFFIANNRYYNSPAQGGSYVPKVGDIYFKGTPSDATHTGIVVGVTVSNGVTTLTVVDGNCGARVNNHSLALTDTRIIGFATSCVHTAIRRISTTSHWKECIVCDTMLEHKEDHSGVYAYDDYTHWTKCGECGYQMSTAEGHSLVFKYNTTYHWQECSECGKQFTSQGTHTRILKYDQTYHWRECVTCGRLMASKTVHTFNSLGKCTVCGATQNGGAIIMGTQDILN